MIYLCLISDVVTQVQGRDPGDNPADDSLQDSREDEHFEESYSSSILIELPTPDLAHLTEIQTIFTEQTMHGGGVQWRMEKLAARYVIGETVKVLDFQASYYFE